MAVIFGQPQLLIVDLPYADSMEEFAQQDSMVSEVLEAVHHLDTSYAAFYTALSDVDDEFVRQKVVLYVCRSRNSGPGGQYFRRGASPPNNYPAT